MGCRSLPLAQLFHLCELSVAVLRAGRLASLWAPNPEELLTPGTVAQLEGGLGFSKDRDKPRQCGRRGTGGKGPGHCLRLNKGLHYLGSGHWLGRGVPARCQPEAAAARPPSR